MNAEEKQQYYRYQPGNWFFHTPPQLDPKLHAEMDKIGGLDQYGDPVYRFNWGGVAVIRKSEDDPKPVVKGGTSGTLVKRGRLTARYFHGRDRKPRWLCYENEKGEKVRVGREDEVPQGVIATWEYEYIEFGRLHWFIERKLSAEQLVEFGLYTSASVPRRGDYINLLEIQTPDGGYFEPNTAFVELVMKHRLELENEDAAGLLISDAAAREKIRLFREGEQDARDNAEVDLYLKHTLGIPVGMLPPITRRDINIIMGEIPLDRMMAAI